MELFNRYLAQRAREAWIEYWVKHGVAQEEATRQWEQKLSPWEREEIIQAQMCSILSEVGLVFILLGFLGVGLAHLPVLGRILLAGALFLLAGGLLTLGRQRKQRAAKIVGRWLTPLKHLQDIFSSRR